MAPHTWGKGRTIEESIKFCRQQYGRGMKDYDVYRVHPETSVDGSGAFTYPYGSDEEPTKHRPVLVLSVRKGKEQKKEPETSAAPAC
jgi:hypothetical protein